jgi:O-acetyl-ADP-ribose deacetylase (regulator of RNase III)
VAGEELDKECATLPLLGLGKAQITNGYDLPCKYVIHTSGPVWRGGLVGEKAILRSCYLESLKLAVENGCESVAFPLISAGVYRFPKDMVLKFAVQVITEFLFDHELTVYVCVFDKESYSFSQKLFSDIKAFIDDEYVEEHDEDFYEEYSVKSECEIAPMPIGAPLKCARAAVGQSLREYLEEQDKGFRETLFELVDRSGMTDVECYKKANVDKRTFSKIKSNKGYKPSKQTAIAFAIALRLDLDETQALLATVGFTLSSSAVFDKIIKYFIINGNYDIFEINEALFEFDQSLLGAI